MESVREYMRMGSEMKETELREIASCCLLGLDYLHSRNIKHGVVDN